MNVKEINDSSLSLWASVVCLVVVIACTLAIFWAVQKFEHQERPSRHQQNVKPKEPIQTIAYDLTEFQTPRSFTQRLLKQRKPSGIVRLGD
jgi:hypothetical protein